MTRNKLIGALQVFRRCGGPNFDSANGQRELEAVLVIVDEEIKEAVTAEREQIAKSVGKLWR